MQLKWKVGAPFAFSPPLQMGDGKSIRYKDLHALFEQILEKTMKFEQRDWSESPVRVWVNTFKVFLDEYMTEHMPLDYTASKVSPSEGASPSAGRRLLRE